MAVTDAAGAVSWLNRRGFTHQAALATVSVLRAESGLSTSALNKKEGAFGIAQWTEGRKAALFAFAAAKHRSVYDLELQLEYLLHEVDTGYLGMLGEMNRAGSLQQAITIWVAQYERPENVGEVVRRALAEAGAPFGPEPGHGAGLVQGATSAAEHATRSSIEGHSWHQKVHNAGGHASLNGNTIDRIGAEASRVAGRYRR